jgi:uncharacterized protein (TIGR02996 family)
MEQAMSFGARGDMEQAAFIQAILAEPEDDTSRLVFADWLEERGQEARAAWIRASCKLAQVSSSDPSRSELFHLQWECFQRCRPEWWQAVTGVSQHNDRGMFRFGVRSKAAATRLGKVRWLGDAVAGGWLEQIEIEWCDGSLARALAKWTEAARQVPLFVRPAPQILDEGLAFYLGVPHLWGLDLPGHASRNPSIRRLGQRLDLRELELDGMPEEGNIVAAVFEQVGQLAGLRQLAVRGYDRPNDEDLRPLGRLSGLQALNLSRCVALTDAGLAPLYKLVELRRLELWGCEGISDAGVARLQRALPALRVQR